MSLTLKEFIVDALTSITEAVDQCQRNPTPGALISPRGVERDDKGRYCLTDGKGYPEVSIIEFDLCVAAEKTKGGRASINVVAGSIDAGALKERAQVSHVRFSIPVLLPQATPNQLPPD